MQSWNYWPDVQGMQRAMWARDVRAAVLLLLIARCSLDTLALQQAGGEGVFVDLLSDSDPRIRFHASTFLQQRLRTARPEVIHILLEQVISDSAPFIFCMIHLHPPTLEGRRIATVI